ncbi:Six-hairpin glycosidase-like protein [Xylariales sp. PMI_506]|nr:Six-hairpin glycosidase-like protein [Xylariales sp. PMI_506]
MYLPQLPIYPFFLSCAALGATVSATPAINREKVVRQFNPRRYASSSTTPLQVGNGNFAFGVDITGLQTFEPFATLSTWGWHNFSLPTTPGQTSPDDFTGLDWWTHGRLVNYDQPNPAENDISNWLIQNPQRINLGTIGFGFSGDGVTEAQLQNKSQTLDLWTGQVLSSFTYLDKQVTVETWSDSESDTIGISVKSTLLSSGDLVFFFDYPYPDINKFDDPFVGVFNATNNHTTTLSSTAHGATIRHDMDNTTYYTVISWDQKANISGPLPDTHRYILQASPGVEKIQLSITYAPVSTYQPLSLDKITDASTEWWQTYWNSGAFIDLTSSSSPNATEIQRITILSQYLLAVNSASSNSPQESGLVNIGWYGKFHLEMVLWHLLHFARWNQWSLLRRSLPNMYNRFLSSSFDRATLQGYEGARWGKMTDPTGRSAPGEINSLLIWQQPHPMHFAELEYRSFPTNATLEAWDDILTASADFMASYAFFNESTKVYDLGPPMYPVSENTEPNATVNPTFELAYWRFGLDIAVRWKERQGLDVPAQWLTVRDHLAPLPVENGTFTVYEGIPDMWQNNTSIQDHPAMAGIYGLLPPPSSGPPLNMTVVRDTHDRITALWDIADCYSWDFPLLAMGSLRLGDVDQALEYLLHPLFQFDDAGYPEGGPRVPTPYFPGAGGLLMAVAMMAGGWDGAEGSHFPAEWNAKVEGFVPGL